MEGKGNNITDYRSKLDKTLASPDLTNYETIHSLVKNQILQSLDSQLQEYTECVVERRSKEMFNFLGMLRSASVNDAERSKSNEKSQSGWKVKQDTDEFRVMYREGPKGTPFHTLLVEGYVDGPLDVCLCISCESDLFKKWWPQTAIPTFKVISSRCVQKVRIGEQISLVRLKVSWPLSSREALVHFFALEYFRDGLIVVLLNSISDLETINKSTHGFSRDGIPDAEDVVRMDVVGGFAFQKVTADRSYFRTIANMDMKLDFVPPAFINFISRQVVGSGFKLYKKEIASVSNGGDEKFREALKDPMYSRIHKTLYSQNTLPLENTSVVMLEEQNLEPRENNTVLEEITELDEEEREQDTMDEIIEEVIKTDETGQLVCRTTNEVGITPEVQRALGTLEKAISMLQGYTSNSRKGGSDVENGGHLKKSDVENEELICDQTRGNKGDVKQNNLLIGDANSSSRGERVVAKRKNRRLRFCCFVAQQQLLQGNTDTGEHETRHGDNLHG